MDWKNRWWWPGLSSICRSDETWSDCGYNLKVEPRKFANELDVGNEKMRSKSDCSISGLSNKKRICDLLMGGWEGSEDNSLKQQKEKWNSWKGVVDKETVLKMATVRICKLIFLKGKSFESRLPCLNPGFLFVWLWTVPGT